MKKILSIVSVGVLLIVGVFLGISFKKDVPEVYGQAVRICTVTQSVVPIGHQFSAVVSTSTPGRQWAIIQQPLNATNTVSLAFGATAVAGQGFTLNRDVTGPASVDSASTTEYFKYGFATEFPMQTYVTARTSTGSTTVNLIECK